MNNTPIPVGWLTVQEAMELSGLSEIVVQKRARGIDPDTTYTIMGLTLEKLHQVQQKGHRILGLRDGVPESLPIKQGRELKTLHCGKILLNAEMVAWWKRVVEHARELRDNGHCTIDEFASAHGLSISEVKQALKQIEK